MQTDSQMENLSLTLADGALPPGAGETSASHIAGVGAPAEAAPEPDMAEVPEPAHRSGLAHWLYRHPLFTKEPITYTGYQFFRSSMATIPYGFLMAFGHHMFGLMSVKGQKRGLTNEGMEIVRNAANPAAGVKAVDAAANALLKEGKSVAHLYQEGGSGLTGRAMMRVGNSPLNAAFQIALGFTAFRFVGGLIKNLRDRVMNEKNTEADTAKEVKHAGKTLLETAKINWSAESTGTPIAALVLGFIGANVDQTEKYMRLNGENFTQAVKRVWSRPAKLIQNGAIWTISYSLFFLMAESLFKDKQISRGLWKGHPNSLKNGPDDIVGGPAAALYHSSFAENEKKGEGVTINGAAEEGYEPKKLDNDRATDSTQKLRFPFFTGEPSMGRFIIRRVLPVAVGITGYAALKRAGYIGRLPIPGVSHLDGQMAPLIATAEGTVADGKAINGFADHTKLWLKNSYREGKATATFGVLWMATDAAGTWYDKFFHHLQKPESEVKLTEHQQEKHAELLGKLNEKEQEKSGARVA